MKHPRVWIIFFGKQSDVAGTYPNSDVLELTL